MTKDEMKNRISMALKDPILQQGFEIICKDLAISEHDKEHNDYELTEVYKKVEQLEKEKRNNFRRMYEARQLPRSEAIRVWENVEICSLFGWDNDDKHFKMYADGSDGCVHRKATIEKWWKQHLESCPRY